MGAQTGTETGTAYRVSPSQLLRPLQIGPLRLENNLLLAPMAGITDRPFRHLCRAFGAGLAVSEMLSANPALRGTRKSAERTDHRDEPGPIAVQIAGSKPMQMADMARRCVDQGADIIDINMGCPAKKVCKAAAGSALLRDESLVQRILQAVVDAVPVPVTLKTRTGWSPETRNLARIAYLAQESGIALLAVHGRTRACGYSGRAEFDSLRAIRSQTTLPLVVNGDILTPLEARHALDYTGADAVMIGRGALGRPWVFREMAHFLTSGELASPPPPALIRETLIAHLQAIHAQYGERRGVRIARKHIMWYHAPPGSQTGSRTWRQPVCPSGGRAKDPTGTGYSTETGSEDETPMRTEHPDTSQFLAHIKRIEDARRQLDVVAAFFADRPAPEGGAV
ncbi:tRNA dihydrouridine synthase DusB [Thiohalocapsa marina]|uniref:tRNA dihydrouridine synthase DusB n=1 Tax=Thiohalocapsa marina TaxID=424902 RepID=UPI0036D9C6D8